MAFAATAELDADWVYPFDASQTVDGSFEMLSGTHIDVPLMTQYGTFSYATDTGYEAIELPLSNSDLSMLILMPDSGDYLSFEDALDYPVLQNILTRLAPRELTLYLPKFSFSSQEDLENTLFNLGITDAMEEGIADFSGVNDADDLYINGSRFNGRITITEAGTQAAGSAVVTVEGNEEIPVFNYGGTGAVFTLYGDMLVYPSLYPYNLSVIEVALSRPFIFLLRDTDSGTIVFMGRVLRP